MAPKTEPDNFDKLAIPVPDHLDEAQQASLDPDGNGSISLEELRQLSTPNTGKALGLLHLNVRYPGSDEDLADIEKTIDILEQLPNETVGAILSGRSLSMEDCSLILYHFTSENSDRAARIFIAGQDAASDKTFGLKMLHALETQDDGLADQLAKKVEELDKEMFDSILPPETQNLDTHQQDDSSQAKARLTADLVKSLNAIKAGLADKLTSYDADKEAERKRIQKVTEKEKERLQGIGFDKILSPTDLQSLNIPVSDWATATKSFDPNQDGSFSLDEIKSLAPRGVYLLLPEIFPNSEAQDPELSNIATTNAHLILSHLPDARIAGFLNQSIDIKRPASILSHFAESDPLRAARILMHLDKPGDTRRASNMLKHMNNKHCTSIEDALAENFQEYYSHLQNPGHTDFSPELHESIALLQAIDSLSLEIPAIAELTHAVSATTLGQTPFRTKLKLEALFTGQDHRYIKLNNKTILLMSRYELDTLNRYNITLLPDPTKTQPTNVSDKELISDIIEYHFNIFGEFVGRGFTGRDGSSPADEAKAKVLLEALYQHTLASNEIKPYGLLDLAPTLKTLDGLNQPTTDTMQANYRFAINTIASHVADLRPAIDRDRIVELEAVSSIPEKVKELQNEFPQLQTKELHGNQNAITVTYLHANKFPVSRTFIDHRTLLSRAETVEVVNHELRHVQRDPDLISLAIDARTKRPAIYPYTEREDHEVPIYRQTIKDLKIICQGWQKEGKPSSLIQELDKRIAAHAKALSKRIQK